MSAAVPAPGKRRILVVEDEDEIQVLVRRILRSAGHEVLSAHDGTEALEVLARERPDLVILDIVMPRLDGWGVLKQLRGKADPPPVVLLTGRDDYDTFTRAVREGAVAYVVKPFRFHELIATCQRVLLAAAGAELQGGVERRHERRRFLIVEVDVLDHEDKPMATGEMLELSTSGARLELGLAFDVGERVRVAFHLPRGAPLRLAGEVRWKVATPRGTVHGVEFTDLGPEEQRLLGTLLAPTP